MFVDPETRPVGETETAAPLTTCRNCQLQKPQSAFPKHATAKDGKRRDCQHCIDAGTVPRRSRKPETAAQKARRKSPEYLAPNREASRRWYWANRQKALAKSRAYRARKRSELSKPATCEAPNCARKAADAHQEDYSRPLDVVWLCKPYHRQRHAGTKSELGIYAKARRAGILIGVEADFADITEAW